MADKYLNLTGLSHFLDKIKLIFIRTVNGNSPDSNGNVNTNHLASITLTTSWTSVTGGFSQTINVTGITSNDIPIIALDDSLSVSSVDRSSRRVAFGHLVKVESGSGSITVYSDSSISISVPLLVRW